jgi:hypothetical protein
MGNRSKTICMIFFITNYDRSVVSTVVKCSTPTYVDAGLNQATDFKSKNQYQPGNLPRFSKEAAILGRLGSTRFRDFCRGGREVMPGPGKNSSGNLQSPPPT